MSENDTEKLYVLTVTTGNKHDFSPGYPFTDIITVYAKDEEDALKKLILNNKFDLDYVKLGEFEYFKQIDFTDIYNPKNIEHYKQFSLHPDYFDLLLELREFLSTDTLLKLLDKSEDISSEDRKRLKLYFTDEIEIDFNLIERNLHAIPMTKGWADYIVRNIIDNIVAYALDFFLPEELTYVIKITETNPIL